MHAPHSQFGKTVTLKCLELAKPRKCCVLDMLSTCLTYFLTTLSDNGVSESAASCQKGSTRMFFPACIHDRGKHRKLYLGACR